MTDLLGPHDFREAASVLCSGKLVAFPTETVYGLGADALDGKAVAGIFAAKNRPSFNPLIVHVPDLNAAEKLGVFNAQTRLLAEAFWPGPMSLVVPLRPGTGLSDLVTAGLDTVAIRVPAHPLAQDLLRAVDRPIAAPSANPSGRISPTTAAHVMEGLSGRISAVLDGGACAVGLESSIFGGDPIRLLRPGGISREAAEAVLGAPIDDYAAEDALNAPGQLSSHYAPSAQLQLNMAKTPSTPHLGFGPGDADLNLSEAADLAEAASHLFAMLRQMDALVTKQGATFFTVAPIPMDGLGLAINDRLQRAAAPRS